MDGAEILELTVPTTTVGNLEFGDEPKLRQLPAQPELRLDSLVRQCRPKG
jgi:hypothetical protein